MLFALLWQRAISGWHINARHSLVFHSTALVHSATSPRSSNIKERNFIHFILKTQAGSKNHKELRIYVISIYVAPPFNDLFDIIRLYYPVTMQGDVNEWVAPQSLSFFSKGTFRTS